MTTTRVGAWLLLLAAACTPAHGPTVVVGATAMTKTGPVADSVVILDGPTVALIGTRIATPIPKGAHLVDGMGQVLVASHGALETGAPADLVLKERVDGPPRLVIRGGRVEK